MDHVPYSCVMSHMDESYIEYEGALSHMNGCHVWTRPFFFFLSRVANTQRNHSCVTTHINESRSISMSHVPYQWVTSHIDESSLMSMHHVEYERALSHVKESCYVWSHHIPHEWAMSHINASRRIWMNLVPYAWVALHMDASHPMWMSHIPCAYSISHRKRPTHEWMTKLNPNRPTQPIIYVPLPVNRFQKSILLIFRYTYLKSCAWNFILQSLILHTRSCGTGFITQSSWVVHFHQIDLTGWTWFVPQLYQFRRGIS